MIYDTIVVGTGIGGLTTGLKLSNKGHNVLLIEAGKQFGGMLNPFKRGKFHFDVGIHYVGEAGEGQAMRKMLDSLGLRDLRFREINPDCIDRYVFDGYETKLVKGIDRWADMLCSDFPHEQKNIRRFIRVMKACAEVSRIAIKGPSFSRVARAIPHVPALLRAIRSTLGEMTAHYFDDPLLRTVFGGPGGDIGLPPGRASAIISIMVLNHFLEGAYYPIGGSGAMRDAYVNRLKSNGAEMLRNRVVTLIEVLGAQHFAVHTNRGERFESRSVVSNVDATHTYEMIQGARPNRHFRKKAPNLRPSLGSFCVFIGTDLDLGKLGLSDANIWHYGTNDIDKGYEETLKGHFPDEPFFFLTAPSLKDPDTARAPEGHQTVELITFVPSDPFKPWWHEKTMKRGEDYDRLKTEIADKLIASAERYVPGLRDHIVVQEIATPATVWSFVRGRNGGIYGPEHTPDQMLHRRVFTKIGIPGLYLAGASVIGAGISPCLTSGIMAAGAVQKHLQGRAGAKLSRRSPATAAPAREDRTPRPDVSVHVPASESTAGRSAPRATTTSDTGASPG
jgi:phytoene dehydrogenase-like protein